MTQMKQALRVFREGKRGDMGGEKVTVRGKGREEERRGEERREEVR